MAHKKAGGSSRNGRDSQAKRLGVKAFGGEPISAGAIIIRQRGTKVHPGVNVGIGKDHTLFALVAGKVEFKVKGAGQKTVVSVVPVCLDAPLSPRIENPRRGGDFCSVLSGATLSVAPATTASSPRR